MGDEGVFVGRADRREAVGEEHDEVRAVGRAGVGGQRLVHRLIDRGAAGGFEPVDELHRSVNILFVRGLERSKQWLGLGGESDHLEAVAVIEVVEAEPQGALRLFELGPRHRPAGVEHEADVFGLHFLLGAVSPGEARSMK